MPGKREVEPASSECPLPRSSGIVLCVKSPLSCRTILCWKWPRAESNSEGSCNSDDLTVHPERLQNLKSIVRGCVRPRDIWKEPNPLIKKDSLRSFEYNLLPP